MVTDNHSSQEPAFYFSLCVAADCYPNRGAYHISSTVRRPWTQKLNSKKRLHSATQRLMVYKTNLLVFYNVCVICNAIISLACCSSSLKFEWVLSHIFIKYVALYSFEIGVSDMHAAVRNLRHIIISAEKWVSVFSQIILPVLHTA